MSLINLRLYTICFLDALSVGFVIPILATHIISLGGTHTILGILATFHAAFQIISGPLIRSWKNTVGKKVTLLLTLFISFATYLPLGITDSYVVVVWLRLIFALTSQTQTLSKAFVEEYNPQEKHDSIYNVLNAFTVAGLVVGPVVGGQNFELDNGFYRITMLASSALALCLLICLTLPSTTTNDDKTSLAQKINEDLRYSINNLRSISFPEQWDVIFLKYFYHTSITVFFIKFSLLLRFHYNSSSTIIGYTYAYQSILTFLSHFVITLLKQKFAKDKTNLVSSLFIAAIGFLGLCYAPTYDIYLVSFIPMILAHTLLSSDLKELFKLRSTKEHNIEGAEETLAKFTSVITPVIFGIFCDLYGHNALKTFVIVPLIVDLAIAIAFNSETPAVTSEPEKED